MAVKLRTIGHKLRPSTHTTSITVRPKQADTFYLSAEWKYLMRQLIKQRGRRCEDPDHDAALPSEGVRIFGDHIIELKDGGARLDPRNVLLRCGKCHGRKTALAAADRARG